MHSLTLITGGGRSGKSAFALSRALGYESRVFIATAQPIDDEMRSRIDRHKQEREGSFITIEEPLDLAAALGRIPFESKAALIDCLAVWVGNLMHHRPSLEHELIDAFLAALEKPPADLIIVTNEVGMGIIPDNEMARRYRDLLGMVNQRVAVAAHEVILMVSGIPVVIKGADRG
jgi:adenosylcobinamide kinase / adenosylcobinamide-phosphate guanylyltransferase